MSMILSGVVPVGLSTTTWGARGSKRRALLLHGLGSTGRTWWQIADALARDGYHAVAPDLRGHGNSPCAATYRLDDQVADLVELGTGWDLVVGHSLGGLVAAAAAGIDGFTRRAVLVDPPLDIPDEYADDAVNGLLAGAGEAPDAAADMVAHPNWHPQDAQLRAEAVAAARLPVMERTLHDIQPFHFLHHIEALGVPTVVLGAEAAAGGMFTEQLGARVASLNKNVTFRWVTGAGHSIHRDNPAAVLAAIEHG